MDPMRAAALSVILTPLLLGCGAPTAAPSGPLYLIMPAQPRDDYWGEPIPQPAGASLPLTVIDWHTKADWDELERCIRVSSEQYGSMLISIWRGEVVRLNDGRPLHTCWYMAVVVDVPFRLLNGSAPLDDFEAHSRFPVVMFSLEHPSSARFLSALENTLERCDRRFNVRDGGVIAGAGSAIDAPPPR